MITKENEIKFNQIVLNVELGKFNSYERNQRIIYLSKGLLIALSNEIIFYDYKKFSKKFIMSINKKDKFHMKISKLLDDRFCIYTQNETLIYQFNNDDFTVTLLKKINLNLMYLTEVEKNVFINATNKNIYIWKELKPVIKSDQYIFISLNILIVSIIIPKLILATFGTVITILISIYFIIILANIIGKFIYILNPYKKLKFSSVYNIVKCGNNLCCIISNTNILVLNYKTYEIIYELVSQEENPINWSLKVINENYIILIDEIFKKIKIYDFNKNKIIKDEFNNILENLDNTFDAGDNSFITIQDQMIIRWKYNVEKNDIIILNKEKRKYLYIDRNSASEFLGKNIKNNRLYLLKMKYTSSEKNYKIFNLYVYQ